MDKKTIYLPIEIKVRELTSHVLLSFFAAKKKYRIYLGSKPAINKLIQRKKNKAGIFIFKGGMEIPDILKIKKKVDQFIILDQELSPSCIDFKKEMRRRIWPGSEKYIDKYYLIGQRAYEAGVEVLEDLKDKIVKTGWPSIDLSRNKLRYFYKEKINEIKNKHGEFILFSSAFSYNSKKKIKDIYEASKVHKWKSVFDALEEDMIWAEYTLLEFNKNIELLREIEKDPDCPKIIIRPHPSEDHQEWQKIEKSFQKIKVIFDGEITPWVYSAKGLLHRGCASSIQAYLAGIPVGYPLLSNHTIKKALPYEISEHLYNKKDIIEFCKKNINQEPSPPKKYSEAFNKIVNIENKFASELILEDILQLDVKPELEYKINRNIKDFIFDIIKNNLQTLKESKTIRTAPQSQKMPGGILKKEVEDILCKLEKISLDPPHKKIKVRQVYKDCIEIEES